MNINSRFPLILPYNRNDPFYFRFSHIHFRDQRPARMYRIPSCLAPELLAVLVFVVDGLKENGGRRYMVPVRKNDDTSIQRTSLNRVRARCPVPKATVTGTTGRQLELSVRIIRHDLEDPHYSRADSDIHDPGSATSLAWRCDGGRAGLRIFWNPRHHSLGSPSQSHHEFSVWTDPIVLMPATKITNAFAY